MAETSTHNPPSPPVFLLVATAPHAAGAGLQVAGLTVVERALRQLASRGQPSRVVVACDGTVALPRALPVGKAEIEVRAIAGGGAVAVAELEASLPGATLVPADVVRPGADGSGPGLRVVDEESRARAEDAVFAKLLDRGDLGLVARHINKPLSIRLTRAVLVHLPITPNQVTLAAAAIGLVGCALIASGGYGGVIAGFALAQAQSILDGCDGELARVRFQRSRMGEWLDTMVDDFLNVAITVSVGIGLGHGAWGGAGAALYSTYAAITYSELARLGLGGNPFQLKWWFAGGVSLSAAQSDSTAGPGGLLRHFIRRDTFVFGWLLLAVLDLRGVILAHAVLLSAGYAVAALGQLAWARRSGPPGRPQDGL